MWAQSDGRTGSELLRDVLLTIPPLTKAGVILSSFAFDLAGGPGAPDPYPLPFNIVAYALVAGIAATNIAVIVSGWLDLPNATRFWRRSAFGVDAAGVLFGAAILIADMVQPDPSGSAALPLLSAIASFGALMFLDMIPFSTELRAGSSFGL